MAATVTGTPVAITSTSQSVTVPSGCKAAIFTWSYWNASAGQGLASATLNGASPDATAEAATGAGGADATATGIAVFLAPTTGSQTFAHSFDAATSEGPTRVLTFLTADNAVALRGSLQAANASGASAVDVTLTGLTAGDLAVAHDQTYNVIPGNQSGWTSHQTGTVNNEGFRLRSIAAAGSAVTASAQSLGYASIAAGAFYDAAAGPADPAITDVDTDEIVLDGQTGVAVTGTDLGTTNADRTFTLRQGSTSVPQTETGTGTATAATLTIGIEQSGADIKFGAATLRVTRTSDSLFGDLAVTVNPPTGQLYVDIGTPDATAANRITAVADIASGDQIQYRGVGGGAAPTGLTINTDATWQFSSGNTPAAFDVRVWDASDSTWGAWATQSIDAGGVALTGAAITGATGALGAAHANAISGQFATAAAGTITPARTSAITGQSVAAATGALESARTVSLTGQSITTSAGSLGKAISRVLAGAQFAASQGNVSAGSDVIAVLTGQSITASAGRVLASLAKALNGQSATAAQGSVSAGSDVVAALTGLVIASASGALGPQLAKALAGASITSAHGNVAAGNDVIRAITGQAIAASIGTMGPALTKALAGAAMASAQGTVTPESGITVALTGQVATFAMGAFGVSASVAIAGLSAVASGGNLSVSAPSGGLPSQRIVRVSARNSTVIVPARNSRITIH